MAQRWKERAYKVRFQGVGDMVQDSSIGIFWHIIAFPIVLLVKIYRLFSPIKHLEEILLGHKSGKIPKLRLSTTSIFKRQLFRQKFNC